VEKITVTRLAKELKTEADAYVFMEKMRWATGVVCPHCGSIAEHYFLTPKSDLKTDEGDAARKTRTGAASARRLWKCRDCRQPFSVTTGTVMHGSKVSLRIWLFVMFEMAANKNGIAAREIERKYGVASRTAWFMTQRLREAMKRTSPDHLLTDAVVADETWIGGDPKNMHAWKREGRKQGDTDKIPVVTLIDAKTGEARSRVVPNVSGKTLRKVIADNVAMKATTLHTDGSHSYAEIGDEMAGHFAVDHSAGQYVMPGSNGTNLAENYFSQLKRSLDGTHHHVSERHLPRYLAEFDFRYTFCTDSDTARMNRLMGRVGGRRLRYR
jgi:transposase-like protein